jgi:hypothetical protein
MRRSSRLLLAVALALGGAGQAGAVPLTLQGGTLGISIGALPPITFPCNACPLVLDVANPGVGGGFVEPANAFAGSVMLPTALFTGVALINGLTIGNLANGEKAIAPGAAGGNRADRVLRPGGDLGGPGALTGSSFVNVLGLFNLTVPLNIVGNTGATTAVAAGTLNVTVAGTGWTTGTMMINKVTTGDPAGNTVTNAGYDNRTAGGNGVLQLISAFHITTNAAGNLPGLATQTLTFSAPEPGQILLVGAALGTLVMLARRRMQK